MKTLKKMPSTSRADGKSIKNNNNKYNTGSHIGQEKSFCSQIGGAA